MTARTATPTFPQPGRKGRRADARLIAALGLAAGAWCIWWWRAPAPSIPVAAPPAPPAPPRYRKWTYREQGRDAVLSFDFNHARIVFRGIVPVTPARGPRLDWSGVRVPFSCLPQVQIAGAGRSAGAVDVRPGQFHFVWNYRNGVNDMALGGRRLTLRNEGRTLIIGTRRFDIARPGATIVVSSDGAARVIAAKPRRC